MRDKVEYVCFTNINDVGVTVSISPGEFKISPTEIFGQWTKDPRMSICNNTIGTLNRARLHQYLDMFIDQATEDRET